MSGRASSSCNTHNTLQVAVAWHSPLISGVGSEAQLDLESLHAQA